MIEFYRVFLSLSDVIRAVNIDLICSACEKLLIIVIIPRNQTFRREMCSDLCGRTVVPEFGT